MGKKSEGAGCFAGLMSLLITGSIIFFATPLIAMHWDQICAWWAR